MSPLLSGVGLVHKGDFAGYSGPFKVTSNRHVALLLKMFIPFEEFVAVSNAISVSKEAT